MGKESGFAYYCRLTTRKISVGFLKCPQSTDSRVSSDECAGLQSRKSLVPDVRFSKVVVVNILLSFAYSENILGVSKVPAVNPQPGKLR